MKNCWLKYKELKENFPIGSEVKIDKSLSSCTLTGEILGYKYLLYYSFRPASQNWAWVCKTKENNNIRDIHPGWLKR